MPFPESPRVVYGQNPIVEVICQLRFPTILAIASEAPTRFQETVRDRYPLYQREGPVGVLPEGVPPDVAQMVQSLPMFQTGSPTHRFLSPDSQRQIALASNFVAVTESDYTEWPTLRAEIDAARAAIETAYNPAFYERVGLRYRNRIDRVHLGLAERPWSELLRSEITGLLGSQPDVAEQVQETTTIAEVRIASGTVRVSFGFEAGNAEAFIVDSDFYSTERSDHERVGALLDDFNRAAGNLFRWAIKPPLHDALLERHT